MLCVSHYDDAGTVINIFLFPSCVLWDRNGERYLQQSKMATMHFQPSLPRLPIPELSLSIQRYLAALRPILTDQELAVTKQISTDFSKEGSDGRGMYVIIYLMTTQDCL